MPSRMKLPCIQMRKTSGEGGDVQEAWKGEDREFSSGHVTNSLFSSGPPRRVVELAVEHVT